MHVMSKSHHHALSFAGLIITVGIIFGDIGTSPLYVLKAIVGDRAIDETLVDGLVVHGPPAVLCVGTSNSDACGGLE